METILLLILTGTAAALLTGFVALALRRLGIAPARPEDRTRGIELLIERLRQRFPPRA